MKTRAKRLEESKGIAAVVNSANNRLVTSLKDVKIVYGTRSVILYSGVSGFGSPYLFRFDSGDPDFVSGLADVTLVRLCGKWTLR